MKLTKAKAKTLLKQELGLSGDRLLQPKEMNGNPSCPYYVAQAGALTVSIYGAGAAPYEEMAALHLSFYDGLSPSITKYYYLDTLEEAAEHTELRRWEDAWEMVEEKQKDRMLNSLKRKAQEAARRHKEGK